MQATPTQRCGTTVSALNDACFCISLDQGALADALTDQLGNTELKELLETRSPPMYLPHVRSLPHPNG